MKSLFQILRSGQESSVTTPAEQTTNRATRGFERLDTIGHELSFERVVMVNIEISRATASTDRTATVLGSEESFVVSHPNAVRLTKPYIATDTPSTAALARKAYSAALGSVET